MRFLLQGRKLPIRGIVANSPLPPISISTQGAEAATASKIFGQQCSSRCGCVLRFEASVNANGSVLAATYHAKQILCSAPTNTIAHRSHTYNDHSIQTLKATSSLQPALTMCRDPTPLFTDCSCPSLHRLAKQVVAHLPHLRHNSNLRNQVEFTGVRSSLAFSHAVLRRFQLPTHHTQCLALVEDALNAMIKQDLPLPQQHHTAATPISTTITTTGGRFHDFTSWLNRQHEIVLEQAEEEEFVERFGRALGRVRQPRNVVMTTPSVTRKANSKMSSSSPRSAESLMDFMMKEKQHEMNYNSVHDYLQHYQSSSLPTFSSLDSRDNNSNHNNTYKSKLMDWESYVDALHYQQQGNQTNEATG